MKDGLFQIFRDLLTARFKNFLGEKGFFGLLVFCQKVFAKKIQTLMLR